MRTAKVLIFSGMDSNMRYATGLCLHESFIWVRYGEGKSAKEYILVNRLEFPTVKKEARKDIKVICWNDLELDNIRIPKQRKKNLADIASSFLLSYNVDAIQVPDNTWAIHMETFKEHNLIAKPTQPFFPERIIKRSDEVLAIKQTGKVTKMAFKHTVKILREAEIQWDDSLTWNGVKLTSEFLQNEIEKVFIDNGCSSGESIVSCGEQSSEPHNRGSGTLKAGHPIVVDLFPKDNKTGYYFDMTRTIIKGTPTPELKNMLQTVKRAQKEALELVRPGPAEHVHLAARKIVERAGFKTTDEEGFLHSTGHGVGVDLHEPPRIGDKSEDILEPGMVITVEPGLYYKEHGGVRIEDTVLVTKNGYKNLTNLPKLSILR